MIDLLQSKQVSREKFANSMGMSPSQVVALLSGRTKLTEQVAKKISKSVGGTTEFWLRREATYREDQIRLQATDDHEELENWLRELPVADLVRFDWVAAKKSSLAQAKECLRFFGCESVSDWRSTQGAVLQEAAFRTSPTFRSKAGAVAAWLRRGEIKGRATRCKPWNPVLFRESLGTIRGLTRERDPQVFMPELIEICAASGVAVVIVRAPEGCRASGATFFVSPKKAIIVLSFRYLSDDHFWFSFFHEAGHLLLHRDSDLFIDGDAIDLSQEEEEANQFAASTLIPVDKFDEMTTLGARKYAVARFAHRVGIAPGIVVGQLQHHGLIHRNQLNSLKTRYSWGEDE